MHDSMSLDSQKCMTSAHNKNNNHNSVYYDCFEFINTMYVGLSLTLCVLFHICVVDLPRKYRNKTIKLLKTANIFTLH